jgi:hypothetical protein
MEFPIVMAVDIKNQKEYDALSSLLGHLKHKYDEETDEGKLIGNFIVRPLDEQKQARVLISGSPISSGTRSDMEKRYKQECSMSPNSRIVLQEMIDGKWKLVRGTRRVH